jgi:hypothetical protein
MVDVVPSEVAVSTVTAIHPEEITIRLAYGHDANLVRNLAQLDAAPVPAAPVLVAEAGGAPRAALSLRDGHAIADPFFPSERLLALLHVHAAQLEDRRWGAARRRRSALSAARAVWRALAPRHPKSGPVVAGAPVSAREAAATAAPRAYLRAS